MHIYRLGWWYSGGGTLCISEQHPDFLFPPPPFSPSLKVRTEPEAVACVYKGNDVAGVGVVDDENYEHGLQARMPGEVTEGKKNEGKK